MIYKTEITKLLKKDWKQEEKFYHALFPKVMSNLFQASHNHQEQASFCHCWWCNQAKIHAKVNSVYLPCNFLFGYAILRREVFFVFDRQKMYGPNVIDVTVKSYWRLFLEEVRFFSYFTLIMQWNMKCPLIDMSFFFGVCVCMWGGGREGLTGLQGGGLKEAIKISLWSPFCNWRKPWWYIHFHYRFPTSFPKINRS